MPGYIFAGTADDLYVNLYIPSRTSFALSGNSLTLEQSGNMPWEGNTGITIHVPKPFKAKLHLRIPLWATNDTFPGNLYSFYNQIAGETVIRINDASVPYKMVKGYAVIDRKWKEGDRVEIGFPFEVRKITAHPAIADDRGKMAFQLGPLVYCAEFADQDQPRVLDLLVNKESKPSVSWQDSLPGGSNLIILEGARVAASSGGNSQQPAVVKAIPYYAWSHRGKGEMAVWLATDKDALRPSTPKP